MKYVRDLRSRLLLVIWIGLLPAYGIMVYTFIQTRPLLQSQAYARVFQNVHQVSNRLDNLVGEIRQLLTVMSQDPDYHNLTPEKCEEVISKILNIYSPNIQSLGIADMQGKVVCSPPVNLQGLDVSIAGDSFFSRILGSRDFTVGEYRLSPVDDRPVVGFGLPLINEKGNIEAVLFSVVTVDTLDDMLVDGNLPANATVTLLDRNNTIIARYPQPEKWLGEPLSQAESKIRTDEREGTYIARDEAGVRRVYAYSFLANIPLGELKLVVGHPTSSAFARLNSMQMGFGVVSVATLLFAVVTVWRLANDLVGRQVHSLVQITQRIAGGDLNAYLGTGGRGGLPWLTKEFDRFIEYIKMKEISRRQEDEAIRHQMARVEALANAANQLNAQRDLKNVLQTSCEIVVRALRISACSIRLYDLTRDTYDLLAYCGLGADLVKVAGPLPRGVYERYEAAGDIVTWCLDALQDPDLPKDLANAPLGWVIASAKMVHEGKIVGLLILYARDEREAAGLQDQMLVKGLADEIGLSVANAQLFDALQKEQVRRAGLLQRVISVQEDERLRIARELHDETSQSLAAINVYVDTATLFIEEQAYSKAVLQMKSIKNMVNRMLGDTRRLIGDLRPTLLDDLGLIPAISWYAEQRLCPAGIDFTIDEDETGIRLPRMIEMALFRIAQEAITNIVRHSQASLVNIYIQKENEEVIFGISDNGVGFELGHREVAQKHRFGLTGIYERVKNLEGNVQIETAKGNGAKIVIRIPVHDDGSII